MSHYSHSKLSTFEQCPLRYRLQYVDKVEPAGESIEAFVGHRVHEALERFYYALAFERTVWDEDTLIATYHASWDALWPKERVFLARLGRSPEQYRLRGERHLRDYLLDHAPFDPRTDRTVAVEKSLAFPLDDAGTVSVRCVIDRLVHRDDGVWEVHDYKTGTSLPDQASLDTDRQLGLYHLALAHAEPSAERIELVWHFLAHRAELRSTRSPEQLAALRESVRTLVDRIERTLLAREETPPRESGLCAWCPYAEQCPARKHVVRVRSLGEAERRTDFGVRLVNGYAHGMSKGLTGTPEEAAYRARLVRYAAAEGVVVLEGTAWQARVDGDTVTLHTIRFGDRRC